MDDGEIFLRCTGDQQPSNGSIDSLINELLKDTHECTHIHTCNPPGPDNSHTHTCFHVHTTKVVSYDSAESAEKKTQWRRPLGNREAVRKYRQKNKARTASLEDELLRLKAVNQQLLKRLQLQAALEAEVARLKCLLVDIRGRIEGEIGSFPYQKSAADPGLPGGSYMNMNMKIPCDAVQCANVVYCNQNGEILSNVQGFSGSDFETLNCFASVANLAPTVNSPGASASQRRGSNNEATTD